MALRSFVPFNPSGSRATVNSSVLICSETFGEFVTLIEWKDQIFSVLLRRLPAALLQRDDVVQRSLKQSARDRDGASRDALFAEPRKR